MTKVLDPAKDARKEARKQQELMKQQAAKQKQEQKLAQAEADSEMAKAGIGATATNYGKRSLISGVQKRTELG